MTRLILIRHGESTWNLTGRYQGNIDTELSERGVQQAACVSERLKDVSLDAIYSSPLRRAFHTAIAVALPHSLDIQVDEDLIEIDHGAWNGLLKEEVEKRYGPLLERWLQTPSRVKMPGGESLGDVARRVQKALGRIAAAHPQGAVAICSHDAVLKTIVALSLGMDLDNFWGIRLDNASITIIDYDGEGSRILVLNDACHLGGWRSDVSGQAL